MHFCRKSEPPQSRGAGSLWGGIVSARLSDTTGALETTSQTILGAVKRKVTEPMLDTASPITKTLTEEGRGGRVLVASSVG